MAVNEDLTGFVRESLSRDMSRTAIESVLNEAGWGEEDIHTAMGAFADVDFPVPVPKPKPYLSAREAFLYLVLFTTLYIVAFNLGSLLFSLIERAIPDPLAPDGAAEIIRQTIRWAISSLAIAVPVFLYVFMYVSRAVRIDPSKRGSKVRKWLTYATLFAAAGTIIGDLIALVNNFLAGEMTVRFLLKVLVVGAISGVIFWYYLTDVGKEEEEFRE